MLLLSNRPTWAFQCFRNGSTHIFLISLNSYTRECIQRAESSRIGITGQKEKQIAIVSKQPLCAPFVNEANKQMVRYTNRSSCIRNRFLLALSLCLCLLKMKNMTGTQHKSTLWLFCLGRPAIFTFCQCNEKKRTKSGARAGINCCRFLCESFTLPETSEEGSRLKHVRNYNAT